MLSRKGDAALHRQVFILAGHESWQEDTLKEILQGYESDSLWVGEQTPEIFPFIPVKKARSWLGNEKQVVVFDANKDFDPDSFAAISGIVVGGGLFILLMPAEGYWNDVYSSCFGQRILQSINSTPELVVIKQNDGQINFCPDKSKILPSQNYIAPFLTAEQQYAVETIEEQVLDDTSNPMVLISDRGRGKSATLGLAAARLLEAGIKHIAVTAPRLRATDIIFKHIAAMLPNAVVTRGKVTYGERVIQFYPPDQLAHDEIDADLLLIDEAAAIPVPLLTSFLHKYLQCVFATTVHGYEGTGRGFALRFNKILDEKNPGWIKLQLEAPIRWPVNDPLEKWMFSLLCLDAEIIDTKSMGEIDPHNLKHHFLMKEQFADNPVVLNEVFALLVLAHYRTRPNDLKNLLDDENLSLYVTLYKKHVVAVALVSREGKFSDTLSVSVYRGERRLPGNLLAQALTYHCGVEHAATLDYARVMRIAVHPDLQQQGIGTTLLDFIISNEKQCGRDAIGTSFGMNKPLLNFWNKSKFNVVRIGFTREQTSGEHAAIMLLPLSEKGKKVHKEAHIRFEGQCFFWFDDVLKGIPLEIKEHYCLEKNGSVTLTGFEKKDLESFNQYSRNYELCIAALNKFVMMNQDEIAEDDFPDNFRQVLNNKVAKKISWKEIGKKMGLNGQNEARKLFRQAICYLT